MLDSLHSSNRDLSALSEEEIVGLACSGDGRAEEELFRRYFPIVRLRAREYYLPGAEQDDLLQEGLIGFLKALRDFRSERGHFRPFADLCVRRQIISALKSSTRVKHAILNQACSLDAPLFADPESSTLKERLPSNTDVEKTVVSDDLTEIEILERASQFLTKHEFSVLQLYAQGYDYRSIAGLLGRSLKSIDNAVFKVKLKLRRQRELICPPGSY